MAEIKVGALVKCIDADKQSETSNMKLGQVYEVERIVKVNDDRLTTPLLLLFLKGAMGSWLPDRFQVYSGTTLAQADTEDYSDQRAGYRFYIRTLVRNAQAEGVTTNYEELQSTPEPVTTNVVILH